VRAAHESETNHRYFHVVHYTSTGLPKARQNDAMTADPGAKLMLEDPEILLTPEIPHAPAPGYSEVPPPGGNVRFRLAPIEEADGQGSVFHFTSPHLERSLFGHPASRLAQGVLIHVDDFVVA
jgi:hypothetical protein